MKFESGKPVVQPFTIKLETQGEIDMFAALIGATAGSVIDKFGITFGEAYDLYKELHKLASTDRKSVNRITLES